MGAGPDALRPTSFPVPASQYMTKRSPPRPVFIGSTTASTVLAAMAASTADPPRARICAAADEASVWLVAAMPCCAITMERP